MSKPRYKWWGYVKAVAKAYPKSAAGPRDRLEKDAVKKALSEISASPVGAEKRRFIERYHFEGYTMDAASIGAYISPATARRWNREFMLKVARHLGLL